MEEDECGIEMTGVSGSKISASSRDLNAEPMSRTSYIQSVFLPLSSVPVHLN